MRLRTNVPTRSVAYHFNVHESTILRTFNEIEIGLTQFSKKHGSCYNAEQIMMEHTSHYARLAHGSGRLILCLDGGYLYRSGDHNIMPLIKISWRKTH